MELKSDRDENNQNVSVSIVSPNEEDTEVKHAINYVETLTHFFKSNLGVEIFAMGMVFKNCGIILGSFMIPFLGLVYLHCAHLLVNASNHAKQHLNLKRNPDYATTAEVCLANGPSKLQALAPWIKIVINVCLCLIQLGYCCIFFMYISTNMKQISDYYEVYFSIHLHMLIILIPIYLCCVVPNLKCLAPLSTVANCCMLYGIAAILYYTCQTPYTEVQYVPQLDKVFEFFGTALYAFAGIGLVLPLQNAMKNPKEFERPLGVLNMGVIPIIICFFLTGIFSYLRYGKYVYATVLLNLPQDEMLARSIKVVVPIGILLSYALHFYVPMEIIFPVFQKRFGPFQKPRLVEVAFRFLFVLLTFTAAQVRPFLPLFISMVGSVCCVPIALIFPAVLEIVTTSKLTVWIVIKNVVIIGMGMIFFVSSFYETIGFMIEPFKRSVTTDQV